MQIGGKAGQTSLGFAGAQIMGFGNTIMNSKDMGYQTAPRLGGMGSQGMIGGGGSGQLNYNQSYTSDRFTQGEFRT